MRTTGLDFGGCFLPCRQSAEIRTGAGDTSALGGRQQSERVAGELRSQKFLRYLGRKLAWARNEFLELLQAR